MKRRIRGAVVGALEFTGILPRIRRRADTTRAMILRYHSVSAWSEGNELYRDPERAIDPPLFERQMSFLCEWYRVLPLSTLVDCLTEGRPFPPQAVAITFDDGYRDNFEHALPILKKYDLPATVFVTVGAVGDGWVFWVARLRAILLRATVGEIEVPGVGTVRLSSPKERKRAIERLTIDLKGRPLAEIQSLMQEILGRSGLKSPPAGASRWMMNWPEVVAMARSGIDIGGHTVNHPVLSRQTEEDARTEIERSRQILADRLGEAPSHFAYPNGRGGLTHNEITERLVKEAGFRSASTSVNGCVRLGADPFRLERLGVGRRDGLDGFVFNLERDRVLRRR